MPFRIDVEETKTVTFLVPAAPPAVSGASQGRIYFDGTAEAFLVSENTGAYRLLLPRTPVFQENVPNATATSFSPFGIGAIVNAAEGPVKVRAPFAGTIKNLRATAQAAFGGGANVVMTLRVNGVDRAVTLTITDPATEASDLVNAVAVAAGDQVTWKFVASGGTSALLISVELDPA